MKAIADYHSHTRYSDATGTCRQMVERANELGLTEFAVTDHGYATNFLGLSRSEHDRQLKKLDVLQEEFPKVKILRGIEANLISLDGDLDLEVSDFERLDIVQFGFHRPIQFWKAKQFGKLVLRNLGPFKQDVDANTNALLRAMERYPLQQLSHLNNVMKVHVVDIAKEAAKRGILLELNEKHWSDIDPVLDEIVATGVNFILGSDAHKPENLAKFTNVFAMIERHGLDISRVKGLSE